MQQTNSQRQSSKTRQSQAQPQVNEYGTIFGELDSDKKYPFPIGWMGMVVVTQFNVFAAPSGQQMVDEGTRRTMPYDPAVFTKLIKDKGFNDMQYYILHDPR